MKMRWCFLQENQIIELLLTIPKYIIVILSATKNLIVIREWILHFDQNDTSIKPPSPKNNSFSLFVQGYIYHSKGLCYQSDNHPLLLLYL